MFLKILISLCIITLFKSLIKEDKRSSELAFLLITKNLLKLYDNIFSFYLIELNTFIIITTSCSLILVKFLKTLLLNVFINPDYE